MNHLFFALLAIAALALTARVAWPLRSASPRLFVALIISAPILLIALYQITGTPAALVPGTANTPPDDMPHSLEDAIAQLEQSLQQNPDQPEGWALLARSHAAQGNLTRARDAWSRALELAPDEPILLTEAAQSRAQAHPQNLFDDEALALLERAIAVPVNAHPLSVHVALAPALNARAKQDPNATVFIFARIPGGPPMPVAVERLRLADLPATVTLDDTSSPMPTQTLSDLDEVEVLARLSASGSAVRQEGDIDSAPVRVGLPYREAITLEIGGTVPDTAGK